MWILAINAQNNAHADQCVVIPTPIIPIIKKTKFKTPKGIVIIYKG